MYPRDYLVLDTIDSPGGEMQSNFQNMLDRYRILFYYFAHVLLYTISKFQKKNCLDKYLESYLLNISRIVMVSEKFYDNKITRLSFSSTETQYIVVIQLRHQFKTHVHQNNNILQIEN